MSATEQISAGPTFGKIYGAIIHAKREVGAIGKNGQVKEYGTYEYRKFDDVIDGVAPVLDKHGIAIVAKVLSKEERQDAKKHFVTVTMQYRLYAEDGSYVEGSQVGEAFDVGDKAATKAQTVAMRIFLCTTFNIPYNEMKDPEEGKQHEWTPKNGVTYTRLLQSLISLQDVGKLALGVKYACNCVVAQQKNGDRLTRDELQRLIPEFTAAARRLRVKEEVVQKIEAEMNAALRGEKPKDLPPEVIKVEPVRYKELCLDFGVAKDNAARDKVVMMAVQSFLMDAVSVDEMTEFVAEYCPEDDSNGVGSYLLGAIHSAGSPSEISGLSSSVTMALQQGKIGRDVSVALSQYAQKRIDSFGGDTDGDA